MQDYENQEKIVLDRIGDKARSYESKELSNEEKAKIISERDARQKRSIEKQEEARQRAKQKEESDRKNHQRMIKSKNSEKAEILRTAQVRKAEESQARMMNSTDKRTKDRLSLKGGKNIRSKVSQNSAKKQQQLKNNFTDRED